MKDQIKFIAYAYPTSDRAKELGVYKQGGWFVAQSHRQEDRTMSPPYIAQGHDVFSTKDDVDMYQLLKESDGTYSQVSCLGQYDHTIRTCVKDAGINLVTGEQHNSYDEMQKVWAYYGFNGTPMTKVEFDLCKSYNVPDHDVYNIGCDLVAEAYETCLEAIQDYMS